MIDYTFFYIVWLVELFIGISMFILLVLGKTLYEARQVRYRRIETRLQQNIFLLMTRQKQIEDIDWGHEAIPRPMLLTLLEDYHANFQDEYWDKTENFLTEKYLLPWARLNTHRKRWIHRNHVARIFLLHPEEQDKEHILHLLEDKSFFIRMVAAEALGELKIKATIEPLLFRMSREPKSCRFIYRHVLLKMRLEDSDEILRIYHEAEDEQLCLCCLDILSYRYFGNIYKDIKQDMTSQNSSIRLRIAKILANIATEEATEDLTKLLNDSEPRIRQEALRGLGVIQSKKSFAKVVPMIHDPVYEVRLQAAKTLIHFKKEGRRVLEQQDWDIDPLAYEVARYVLTS